MKKTFKSVFAFVLIFILMALASINFLITRFGKEQVELFASRAVEGEVKIDRFLLHYYPMALSFKGIEIKKYNESDPLKTINVKQLDVGIKAKSLFSEPIIVKYVKVDEPKIVFDAGELGIKDLSKKAVKEVAIGVAGQALLGPIGLGLGIAKKGVDVVKGAKEKKEKQEEEAKQEEEFIKNAEKQKQFIIKKLNISSGEFIPFGDVLWLNKGESVKLPDIKMKDIDNASGLKVAKRIKEVVEEAVKDRLTLKNKNEDKKESKKESVKEEVKEEKKPEEKASD